MAAIAATLLVVWPGGGAIPLCYKLKLKRAWRAPVSSCRGWKSHCRRQRKNPVVVWLVEQLQQRGIRVGVVSRGYGGGLNLIRCYCRQIPPQHRRVMSLC